MALVVSVGYSTPTTAKGTERKQKLGLNRADHRSPENQSFLILRNPFPLRLPIQSICPSVFFAVATIARALYSFSVRRIFPSILVFLHFLAFAHE